MKIGIIVHSKTGHTLSVAEKLNERFLADGHAVSIERVTAANDSESNADLVLLTNAPKPDNLSFEGDQFDGIRDYQLG